ncbi:MAG: Na+/H+ antiporter NhaA [Saprospiraceae bacterium]|nr:Na+/H+ antiporter NhaA [Saprospiraceae bacterium]
MVYKVTKLFREFFDSEKAGGFLLMGCAVLAIALANSAIGVDFLHFWHRPIPGGSLEFWINDGLMAIFFLLIGLEIERELYQGELSDWRNAMLPVAAAIGGMVAPALIYWAFNAGQPSQSGFGIPMATDIAFALGVLSLAGKKAPTSLKIFLTALAIIDDLGAILVIALFYGEGFSWLWLLVSAAIFGSMVLLNRLKINKIAPYLLLGAGLWYALHEAGIHATIAGVLTAFALPFGDGGETSPSWRLQHFLHKPVAFAIMPVFAMANAGLPFESGWFSTLNGQIPRGIFWGLVLGKPLGVLTGVRLALFAGARLPDDLNWRALAAGGVLAGIGFTMSIFITLLAFDRPEDVVSAKSAILAASLVAGLAGYLLIAFQKTQKEVSE